jgi:hypothetical protein
LLITAVVRAFAEEVTAMAARKTGRSKKSAPAGFLDAFTTAARATSTRTMYFAVVAVLGIAVLIGAATANMSQDAAASHAAVRPASAASQPAPPASASASAADAPVPPVAAPAAEPTAAASSRSGPVTTITGCLAREDTAYKLKDTAGDDAPKARSWKTGFLKKGSAPIELYDSANRVKLPAHVGQRISVTGELVDREMYVRSLQRVSANCATKS